MFQEWALQVLRRVRTVTLRWVLKRDRSKPWRLHGDSMPWVPWVALGTSLCSSEACREESGSRQGRVLSSLGWYSWRTQGQTLSVISRNRFHAVSCANFIRNLHWIHASPCCVAVLWERVLNGSDLPGLVWAEGRDWETLRWWAKLAEACWSAVVEVQWDSMSCPSWRKNKKNKLNPFRVVPSRSSSKSYYEFSTWEAQEAQRNSETPERRSSWKAATWQISKDVTVSRTMQEVCKKYARRIRSKKFITCCFWYLWCLPFKSSLTDFGACLFACWQFWGRKSNEDFVFICVSAVFLQFFAGVQLLQVQNKLDLPNAEGTGLFRAHEARRG